MGIAAATKVGGNRSIGIGICVELLELCLRG